MLFRWGSRHHPSAVALLVGSCDCMHDTLCFATVCCTCSAAQQPALHDWWHCQRLGAQRPSVPQCVSVLPSKVPDSPTCEHVHVQGARASEHAHAAWSAEQHQRYGLGMPGSIHLCFKRFEKDGIAHACACVLCTRACEPRLPAAMCLPGLAALLSLCAGAE